jgi:hypothetical protein
MPGIRFFLHSDPVGPAPLTANVRMKTYACLKCGRSLESSECTHKKGKWVVHQLCPGCESPIYVSGGALIVVGLLWMLLWSMILCAGAGLVGAVGGIGFIVAGVARLVLQLRARRRTKCELGAAPNGGPAAQPVSSGVTKGPPSVS